MSFGYMSGLMSFVLMSFGILSVYRIVWDISPPLEALNSPFLFCRGRPTLDLLNFGHLYTDLSLQGGLRVSIGQPIFGKCINKVTKYREIYLVLLCPPSKGKLCYGDKKSPYCMYIIYPCIVCVEDPQRVLTCRNLPIRINKVSLLATFTLPFFYAHTIKTTFLSQG